MRLEAARLRRRERKRRARANADLPFKCDQPGCTASYPSENGRSQHLRREHGVLGRARRELNEHENFDTTQARFSKVRAYAVRGGKMDSGALWEQLADHILPKRSAAR